MFHSKDIAKQYKKFRDETGIQEFTFHWMRNLAVSALSSMGIEITHLSAMLGHTDSGTIRKYLSLQREASTAVTNQVDAFENFLKVPSSGERFGSDGSMIEEGIHGSLWSSHPSPFAAEAQYFGFSDFTASSYSDDADYGRPVRCVKD